MYSIHAVIALTIGRNTTKSTIFPITISTTRFDLHRKRTKNLLCERMYVYGVEIGKTFIDRSRVE